MKTDIDYLTPDYQTSEPLEGDPDHGIDTSTPKIVEGKVRRQRVYTRREIDRDVVIKLARLHVPTADIAKWFGVNTSMIERRFTDDIMLARTETKAKLRSKMLDEAFRGNSTMLIWLSKNMIGFGDNGPINNEDKKPLPWTD
jgi:hypothetical protein